MKNILVITCGVVLVSSPMATDVMARSNILTGGLTLSYDYQDRRGDSGSVALVDSGNEDYKRIVISPLIQIVSSSLRDRFEIRLEPGFRYDLDESDTDWDSDFIVAAERSISQAWQISGSNSFFRSDYNNTSGDADAIEPDLSPNLGRERYWRNTLNLESNYDYREDSLFLIGASWIVLRNDDSAGDITDYDRYSLTLRNEHRYTARWKTTAEFTPVRGDYEEIPPEPSEDLYEYYLELGVENNTISRNPLFATYNYTGIRYDEEPSVDYDIHQLLVSWRHDFSPQFYTVIGAGPAYIEDENGNDDWTTAGTAEVDYQVRRGFYRFTLEKGFEADNFSGTDRQAVADFWNAQFSFEHQPNRVFTVDGRLAYRYEDRTEQVAGTLSDEINENRYTAEVGLGYLISQYYSARVSYTFISQDSDVLTDNYDDHRVVLSLSWEQDLLRW
jgi:hypothetical protein